MLQASLLSMIYISTEMIIINLKGSIYSDETEVIIK